jgi:phosphoglycolate phosphatase
VHLLAERGWRHAVATNKADAYVEPILAHCGLSSLIAAWRGGDGPRKPDPAQVVSLHQQLGATAAWMIGDHHTDLLAAAAAGIPAIFCTWGLGHDGGVPARARVNAPADLPELIGWP